MNPVFTLTFSYLRYMLILFSHITYKQGFRTLLQEMVSESEFDCSDRGRLVSEEGVGLTLEILMNFLTITTPQRSLC